MVGSKMTPVTQRRFPSRVPGCRAQVASVIFFPLFIASAFLILTHGCDKKSEPGDHPIAYTEERDPCDHFNPLRNLYFGDLHAHTALSYDAYIWDSRGLPEDAYQFAKGESILLPPLDQDGNPTRPHRIGRPLDFATVTDHIEFFAETAACIDPDSVVYESDSCEGFRRGDDLSMLLFSNLIFSEQPVRFQDICGSDAINCTGLATQIWEQIQEAAEEAYDRSSACSFTSFIAFEYTGTTNRSNLHRNAFFRNSVVPELPPSYFEQPDPIGFLAELKSSCDSLEGCEVLSIPHNSNESNNKMFSVAYQGVQTPAEELEIARLRAEMEPLAEITQHKGESECLNGLSGMAGEDDELCDFEKIHWGEFEDCGDGFGEGGTMADGCTSRLDYLRGALLKGLEEEERLGVNPYRLGIVGGTDTHNATPGAVEEYDFAGHLGDNEDTVQKRLGMISYGALMIMSNPGGLTAVWSEENSRDAIFNALQRRETYATSGPRISVRFFGGWNYPDTMCGDDTFAEIGYQGGVPMGQELPAMPDGASIPTFGILAVRDQGTHEYEGTPLQRIQIIKGWLESATRPAYKVFEVAGDPENGASVNLDTCATTGEGFDTLCTVWTDPEFNPAQRAFYYVRVIENPTCRWNTHQCLALDPSDRPESCSTPGVPRVIQERAWTSPIWYSPE